MKIHSQTGASSAERWMNCPGSVRLCATVEKQTSEYAEEGTRAHEIAEKILRGEPTGPVDQETMEAVMVYVNYVQDLYQNLPPHKDNQFHVELKFHHKEIHEGFYGTSDSAIYAGATKTLYVTDYKHGAGKPVSAVKNKQLCYYGIGAMMKIKMPIERVVLAIVQPRYSLDEAVNEWEISPSELLQFLGDVTYAIAQTELPDAPFIPGDEQCFFCDAKHICPALKEKTKQAVMEAFSPGNLPNLSQTEVGKLMRDVGMIESWCKAVKQFAYTEAAAGRVPDGYKIVPKRAMRKWINIDDANKKLGIYVNANTLRECYSEPELKSPAQVEKLIGGEEGKNIVKGLVVAVSSGDTLVPLEDNRIEINKIEQAKAMFADE